MDEEIRYKLLKILENSPDLSQRDLSKSLGISLGKVNYCLNALKEKGLIKARTFKNHSNKKGYLYILTPKGLEEKGKVTARFLQSKVRELEVLKSEIEQIRSDLKQ